MRVSTLLLGVQLDDEVFLDGHINVLAGGQLSHGALEGVLIALQPLGNGHQGSVLTGQALEGHGAKPMENPLGKELDPNFHEAIATLPDEKYEEGKISNIVKTGWMLGDKLLRVAQVVVSSGKKQ